MKTKMWPSKKVDESAEKKKKEDLPSPGQYDIENSFKNTQIPKARFFISKCKILKLIE
jgi:hypothetical protein